MRSAVRRRAQDLLREGRRRGAHVHARLAHLLGVSDAQQPLVVPIDAVRGRARDDFLHRSQVFAPVLLRMTRPHQQQLITGLPSGHRNPAGSPASLPIQEVDR